MIVETYDADTMRPHWGCTVHCCYVPGPGQTACKKAGQPASPVPMHGLLSQGRDRVIGFWRQQTGGQRTLVLHRGDPHDMPDPEGTTCTCDPEVIPPEGGG